jgi:hypothetical protein
MLHNVCARLCRLLHSPRIHYALIGVIGVSYAHEGAKLADLAFLLLAIACEVSSNG